MTKELAPIAGFCDYAEQSRFSWLRSLSKGVAQMFSRNKRLVSYLASLIVVFGVVMVPSAAQAQEVPVPATTIVDRCGAALDEIFVPMSDAAAYYRDVVNYDYPLVENSYHSSGGAAYVKIIAEYTAYDSNGVGYLKQEVFEHTFDTSAPDGCPQAPNTGSVTVGACNPDTGGTQITVRFTNTAEPAGYPVDSAHFMGEGSGGNAWNIVVSQGRVEDGATVTWTGGQSLDQPVYPGHYVGFFSTANLHNVLVDNVPFTVPACGTRLFPGSGGIGTGGGSMARPAAKLKLVNCQTGRVRATLNAGKVGPLTRFKLEKKVPGRAKPISRTFKVKPGARKKVYARGTNTVYKVFYKKTKKRWVKLDRLRTPPQSRCGR